MRACEYDSPYNFQNFTLLTFGAHEDAASGEDVNSEEFVFTGKKKSIVRPDCTFTKPPLLWTFFGNVDIDFWIVVGNPRAVVVAVPDFSQPFASNKSLNVAKEIPKEPKVKSFVL